MPFSLFFFEVMNQGGEHSALVFLSLFTSFIPNLAKKTLLLSFSLVSLSSSLLSSWPRSEVAEGLAAAVAAAAAAERALPRLEEEKARRAATAAMPY